MKKAMLVSLASIFLCTSLLIGCDAAIISPVAETLSTPASSSSVPSASPSQPDGIAVPAHDTPVTVASPAPDVSQGAAETELPASGKKYRLEDNQWENPWDGSISTASDGVNYYYANDDGIIRYNPADGFGMLVLPLSERTPVVFAGCYSGKLLFIQDMDITALNLTDFQSSHVGLIDKTVRYLDEGPISRAQLHGDSLYLFTHADCYRYSLLDGQTEKMYPISGTFTLHGRYLYYIPWRSYEIVRTDLDTGIEEWVAGYTGGKYRYDPTAPEISDYTFIGDELYYFSEWRGDEERAYQFYRYVDGYNDEMIFELPDQNQSIADLTSFRGDLYYARYSYDYLAPIESMSFGIYRLDVDSGVETAIIPDIQVENIYGVHFSLTNGLLTYAGNAEILGVLQTGDYADVKGYFGYYEPFIAEADGYTYYISSLGIVKHNTKTREEQLLNADTNVRTLWLEDGRIYFAHGYPDWLTKSIATDGSGERIENAKYEPSWKSGSGEEDTRTAEFSIDGQQYYTTYAPYGIYRRSATGEDEGLFVQPEDAIIPTKDESGSHTFDWSDYTSVNQIVSPTIYAGEIYFGLYADVEATPNIYKLNPQTGTVTLVAKNIQPKGMMIADGRIFHVKGYDPYNTKGEATLLP